MSPEEFTSDILDIESSGDDGEELAREIDIRYATVVGLFANRTARLRFAGEEADSEKEYSYLAWYTPRMNDRVILIKANNAHVILGKIQFNVSPTEFALKDEVVASITDLQARLNGLQTEINNTLTEYVTLNYFTNAISDVVRKNEIADLITQTADGRYARRSTSSIANLAFDATLSTVITRFNSLLLALRLTGAIGS
jgi:hypothetical protein